MNGLVRVEWDVCPECGGKGYWEYYVAEDATAGWVCQTCHGEGEIEGEVFIPEDEPTEQWFLEDSE